MERKCNIDTPSQAGAIGIVVENAFAGSSTLSICVEEGML